jgi:putative transposase
VLLAVGYFVLRLVLRIAPDGDETEREAEILVLRHQLAVLKRTNPRPRLRRRDRMQIAALSRMAPRVRWSGLIVTPSTILRRHRELVARTWTFRHRRTGRPPLDPDLVSLILEMARNNRRWGVIRIKGELQPNDQARAPNRPRQGLLVHVRRPELVLSRDPIGGA